MQLSLLTPEQCQAARALLGWSQSDLEEASGVVRKTLTDFEGGKKKRPYKKTLAAIRSALEEAGILFIDENGDGPGVRLKRCVWQLDPIDSLDPSWAASTYKERIIIRAAGERKARLIATGAFGIATKRIPGATIINPWSRPAGCVTCSRIKYPDYPEDGPDAILSPAEYDGEWRPKS